MEKMEGMDRRLRVLGGLFLLSTRLETMGNNEEYLGELTTKQWFLLVSLLNFFDTPPTVSQLAKQMGTSHQNVKVIATHLQKKNFVKIVKDQSDARASRIIATDKAVAYAKAQEGATSNLMDDLMSNLGGNELLDLERMLFQMVDRVEHMIDVVQEGKKAPAQK